MKDNILEEPNNFRYYTVFDKKKKQLFKYQMKNPKKKITDNLQMFI